MTKQQLLDLATNIQARDKNMVEEMNSWMDGGMTIEKRIVLADARAMDALTAIVWLANHLVDCKCYSDSSGD